MYVNEENANSVRNNIKSNNIRSIKTNSIKNPSFKFKEDQITYNAYIFLNKNANKKPLCLTKPE